jgi:hypothetical protein
MEGMVADGVAASDYLFDYFRMSQGVDAGNKESRLHRILIQQLQYLFRCRFGRTIIKSERDQIFSGITAADYRQIKIAPRGKSGNNAKKNIKKGYGRRQHKINKEKKCGGRQKNYSGNLRGA